MKENDMTDASDIPTLSRAPTVVVHAHRIVRLPVNKRTISHVWARRRMAASIRSVTGTKDGPVHSTPQNHYVQYGSTRIALAIAVRQQLTEPGSVPLRQQLHLSIIFGSLRQPSHFTPRPRCTPAR